MTTYLITGVSGALGSRVLSQLAQGSGAACIGVDSRPLQTSSPNLRFVALDLTTDDLSPVFESVDVVIHLAKTAGVAALRRVLDASDAAGVGAVIATSSAAVLGSWPNNPVPMTEQSVMRPVPGFHFAVDLAEQERLLQQWKDEHPGVAVCTLRMALILGGGLERAFADALGGVESYRRMGSSRPVQFLHVDDAVSAVSTAVSRRLDGLYNVAPDGFVSDASARAITGVVPRPSLPRRLAIVANRVVWNARHENDLAGAYPYLEHPWILSNDKLRGEGWEPRYSSEEALVTNTPEGLLIRFGTRERRRAVTSMIFGSTALTMTTFTVGAAALIRWIVQRRSW